MLLEKELDNFKKLGHSVKNFTLHYDNGFNNACVCACVHMYMCVCLFIQG